MRIYTLLYEYTFRLTHVHKTNKRVMIWLPVSENYRDDRTEFMDVIIT